MIQLQSGVRIYLACGYTDMRRGFRGLAMQVQEVLKENPFSGALFAFRGKRGDLVKILWWDTQGLCLFAKRLEHGRFVWPMTKTGVVSLTPGNYPYFLKGSIGECHCRRANQFWLADRLFYYRSVIKKAWPGHGAIA